MKARFPKTLIVIFLSFFVLPLSGQKGIEDGSKYGHGEDSVNCRKNYSLYKTYYDQGNYPMALGFWRKTFFECPASSSNLHLHGITMFKTMFKQTKNKGYIDTLEMIYDARIKYFQKEAQYLGRKGMDIWGLAGNDIELISLAYSTLEKSINLDPRRSAPNVLQIYMGATHRLFETNNIDNEEVITNYGMLIDILDDRISKVNRPADIRAKETVDMIFKAGGAATCDGLVPLFTQRVADNPTDIVLLKKVINLLNDAGCNDSDLFYTSAENLYKLEKSALAAYNLAEMNAEKMEYDDAEKYYLEAIELEEEMNLTATYYIKLSSIRLRNKDYKGARDFAKKSIEANPDNGTPYMLIGNAYSAVKIFDDALENQMIYWVAADYFIRAMQKDSGLKEKCDEYLASVAKLYPKKEDLFFISIIEEGVSHKVGGWINETTTVRFRTEN